jgi:hypothetical protein
MCIYIYIAVVHIFTRAYNTYLFPIYFWTVRLKKHPDFVETHLSSFPAAPFLPSLLARQNKALRLCEISAHGVVVFGTFTRCDMFQD